jgi:asparagine synthase (glutamine-hydrolysing)
MNGHAMAAVDRLIQYAGGRQIVIPLSGGYDSRFIALMLARRGYGNVLTFTYGIKGNKESGYSQRVARELRLPWHFVEYSEHDWCAAWHTEERRRFQRWASGWTSLPHVQDWIAVRALKQRCIVEDNCVFVPGHSGDFVAGSHIPVDAFCSQPVNTSLLVSRILERHYVVSASTMPEGKRLQYWRGRVLDRAEVDHITSHEQFADAFEKWDWQERQAKYIVNSVRVYEFFGFDWWLPLWDVEFMAFWQDVPLHLRQGRHWYLEQVRTAYAAATRSGVEEALNNSSDIGPVGRLARAVLKQLPIGAKHHLKALRHALVPRKITNSYLISHLPSQKVVRMQRSGYSPIGMLVDEFLELEPTADRRRRLSGENQ